MRDLKNEYYLINDKLNNKDMDYSSIIRVEFSDKENRILSNDIFTFDELYEYVCINVKEGYEAGYYLNKEYDKESLYFNINKYEFHVVIKDGKLVGTASLCTEEDKEDYSLIYYLYIDKEYRRQGIGTLLMTFLEKRSLELNKPKLYLCVHKNNKPALALYEKSGYRIHKE
ncbi:MAG: GNAT family N-acetyltransferase [Anaeroplasmataceae bacterium]